MSEMTRRLIQLLRDDTRFKLEAYQFVREALAYAHDVLGLGQAAQASRDAEPLEAHVTGQELCEAIREYAIEQYGFMAKVVLNSWGIHCTGDFGEVVYNLILIGLMKKSPTDVREDFDDIYDFDEAFRVNFQITLPDEANS